MKCNGRENQQNQSNIVINQPLGRLIHLKSYQKNNIRVFKVNLIADPEIKSEWWMGRCLLYQAPDFFLLEIFHS